jgi:hypothetical protein
MDKKEVWRVGLERWATWYKTNKSIVCLDRQDHMFDFVTLFFCLIMWITYYLFF